MRVTDFTQNMHEDGAMSFRTQSLEPTAEFVFPAGTRALPVGRSLSPGALH